MSEQGLQKIILKRLENEGIYAIKVMSASKRGVPDIVCCWDGKFVSIEVKTPSAASKLTELQKRNISAIQRTGGEAFVVRSLSDLEYIIRRMRDGSI